MADNSKGVKAFYEVLGTMILVSTICFVVTTPLNSSIVTPLTIIPLSLYVAIQIGGKVTGGHFNPAVTLAVHVSNKNGFDARLLLVYWVA